MGVKGKGIATIIEDPFRTLVEAKKIYIKYLGTLDHPIPKMILDSVKKGNHVIIEIDPKFFSTWGFWEDLRIRIYFCNGFQFSISLRLTVLWTT